MITYGTSFDIILICKNTVLQREVFNKKNFLQFTLWVIEKKVSFKVINENEWEGKSRRCKNKPKCLILLEKVYERGGSCYYRITSPLCNVSTPPDCEVKGIP